MKKKTDNPIQMSKEAEAKIESLDSLEEINTAIKSGEFDIQFVPGAFDNFEGTQEELDEFIAEITKAAQDGTLFEEAVPVNIEELFLEDPATAIELAHSLGILDGLTDEFGNEVTDEQIADLVRELTGEDIDPKNKNRGLLN